MEVNIGKLKSVNAFEYFGGVPEIVLTDNMKTCKC